MLEDCVLAFMKTLAISPVLATLASSMTWRQMPVHLQNGVWIMSSLTAAMQIQRSWMLVSKSRLMKSMQFEVILKKLGYPEFGAWLNTTGRPMIYSCSWPDYQIEIGIKVTVWLLYLVFI